LLGGKLINGLGRLFIHDDTGLGLERDDAREGLVHRPAGLNLDAFPHIYGVALSDRWSLQNHCETARRDGRHEDRCQPSVFLIHGRSPLPNERVG
jgi:hypothetical protein